MECKVLAADADLTFPRNFFGGGLSPRFLQTCHIFSVVVFLFDIRQNNRSSTMQVVRLWKRGKDFKQK